MRQLLTTLLLISALTGFAGEDMPSKDNILNEGHWPTPFSAEEIRDGSPAGMVSKYKMIQRGQHQRTMVTTFVGGDAENANFTSYMLSPTGERMGEEQTASATWKELQGHASFPKENTSLEAETITTDLGTYECWKYIVTQKFGGKEMKQIMWFAKKVPGPPVKMVQTMDGETISEMLLTEISTNS